MNSAFIAQTELIMKADCVYSAALNISAHCTRSFHGLQKVHSFVGSLYNFYLYGFPFKFFEKSSVWYMGSLTS